MGHFFSKKKSSSITEQDRAVLQLKSTRDKIRQYQKRSETQLAKDRELAKKLIALHKKERAMLLLRKKRFIEGQLEKTDGQLQNVERMIQDLEFAQVELKVVDSLKVGNEALKEINQLLSIEDVERILDETKEGADKQEEINALLCGFSEATGLSEEELEAELEALVDDGIASELPAVPEDDTVKEDQDIQLPSVPEGELEDIRTAEKSPKRRVALEAT